MKAKFIIGGLIILVFAGWGVTAFLDTTIRYVPFAEARTADRVVQVAGGIDFETVNYDTDKARLEFTIYDLKAPESETPESLHVVYYGVTPGNFEQATSVLVRGKPEAEGFVAEQLLVKCPSKYQGMDKGNS